MRCLACGHCMRGLPESVCPECGRKLNPADDETFDNDRHTKRRRRRFRNVLTTTCGVLLVAGFFPQGLWRGSLTYTCRYCGKQVTATRWQLIAPKWIPFRYPGFPWTSHDRVATETASTETACFPCTKHEYNTFFRNRWWCSRFAAATGAPRPRSSDMRTSQPENAHDLLRSTIDANLSTPAAPSLPPKRRVQFID